MGFAFSYFFYFSSSSTSFSLSRAPVAGLHCVYCGTHHLQVRHWPVFLLGIFSFSQMYIIHIQSSRLSLGAEVQAGVHVTLNEIMDHHSQFLPVCIRPTNPTTPSVCKDLPPSKGVTI
ncbi:hypothetical protein P167DRAFT_238228 [Morchella conica CCBAS932]|uniref:Uncharacterized protein n=1 Tax=Morchella conica CCBAS932 TaxID=1392247 RepID=A0A3N4KRF3_9PEZI|nr:hypothetical protein P167DRAFT_238228 [Morchella conica CCBAS932]